jgi:hypothetical protein
MILSAPLLTTLQRCERRLSLEKGYRVLRVRPKELFDRLLRDAVFAVSNGASAHDAAESACTLYLEAAANPGLDILSDPYTVAQDFCAILRTVLEAASREVLLALKPAGVIKIGDHHWHVQAFRDESGVLHRWTSVDRWDADAQYRELHSWHVFGDCAASGQGMWLHVVEIGRQSKGHQLTPWCRAFKHPVIAKHFRFRHVDGGPLEGGWKPVFYQDSAENDPKTWVDLMERDGVRALHHLQIRDPHPEHVKQFRADLPKLAARFGAVGKDWQSYPMERTACDIPVCPWQPVCYAPPGPVQIEGIGGFSAIDV